jgi:Na+-driven multidrug efflux pump
MALTGMITLEKKCELILYSYFSSALLMPFLCYYLAIVQQLQLKGVWIAFLIELSLSTGTFIVLLAVDPWKKIKGIKDD